MWTAICSPQFYRRFVSRNEELFSEDTKHDIRIAIRQSRLTEYAEQEA